MQKTLLFITLLKNEIAEYMSSVNMHTGRPMYKRLKVLFGTPQGKTIFVLDINVGLTSKKGLSLKRANL